MLNYIQVKWKVTDGWVMPKNILSRDNDSTIIIRFINHYICPNRQFNKIYLEYQSFQAQL